MLGMHVPDRGGDAGMNYYEHHLGDYAAATAHLSWDEDMAYARLIRAYYHHEKPIPVELKDACRLVRAQSPAQRKAVEAVLCEFFTRGDDGWHQKRCDEEIQRFKDKQTKARRSADARWNAKRSDSEGNANASGTHTERNAKAMRTQSEGNAPSLQSQSPVPISRLQTPEKNPPIPPRDRGVSSRRVQKIFDPASIPELDLPSWQRWVQYRAERKPALKPASMEAAAQELAKFGEHQAEVVQHSIANGYQGLFAPKVNGNGAHPAAAPKRYKTADELEDEIIVAALRKGLTDEQIEAIEDLACAPNRLVRIRAKREELQHEQH